MPDTPTKRPDNGLLEALPEDVVARLAPQLERVSVTAGHFLYHAEEEIGHAYFPEVGTIISLLSASAEGESVEVGLVGSEGVACISAFLGSSTTPHEILVQGGGTALRIGAEALADAFERERALRAVLLRYTQALFVQIGQTALCNRVHTVEERMARWLLMTHDRTRSEQLSLTHDFLSRMLGTRRTSVTLVAGALKQAGLIGYRRGQLTLRDREGLESVSCECYETVKWHYARLVGRPG